MDDNTTDKDIPFSELIQNPYIAAVFRNKGILNYSTSTPEEITERVNRQYREKFGTDEYPPPNHQNP